MLTQYRLFATVQRIYVIRLIIGLVFSVTVNNFLFF